MGIEKKIWKIVQDSYKNFKCAALVAGEPGPWFVPERGIHQGAPLSMPFYQIYINDLLHSLRTSTCGVIINDIDVTCPAYADDVAICALHKTGLNILLQIAYSYSKKWLFEFSIEKSVIMTWGRDQFPEIPVMLGGSKLKIVEHFKHVGIELANSKAGKDRIIHEGSGKARHAILAARGIGYSNTPVSVTVLSKIYWAISVARMAYGLEIDVIDENNMEELVKAHRHHAKIVQDIPNMVHKPAVLAPLGWLSMKGYIAIKKMCFLWSILCYPDTGIYKTIALLVINKCNANDGDVRWSPIADMYNTFCKYNMKSVLMSCIQHNECYPGNDMKRLIKKAVWKHEFESWVASQFMYPELDCYYKGVKNISMHCWWRYTGKNPRMTTQKKLTELWQWLIFFTTWPNSMTYWFVNVTYWNCWPITNVDQVWWWYVKAFMSYAWQNGQTNRQVKGQSEIANMPKFNNNILENSQTLVNGYKQNIIRKNGGALYHWQHWCRCGKIQCEWHLISLVSSEFLTYLKISSSCSPYWL